MMVDVRNMYLSIAKGLKPVAPVNWLLEILNNLNRQARLISCNNAALARENNKRTNKSNGEKKAGIHLRWYIFLATVLKN